MPCKVAIVGASTLVGREILKVLSERSFSLSQIRLFDTESSVGQHLLYNDKDVLIEEISEHNLRENKFRIVFFAGGKVLAEQYAAIAAEEGSFVIDTSLYAANYLNAPFVIPSINGYKLLEKKLVANPHSLTVHLGQIFASLLKETQITRAVISTYQSVSGSGFFGVEELERQISEIVDGKEASMHYFSKQIAFNTIPQVNEFIGSNTKEELLIEQELSEIFEDKSFNMNITCVRVPVIRGHSASVMVELKKELSIDDMYYLWENDGIETYRELDDFPTPWELENTIQIGVARLRKDKYIPNCYHFWTVADNLKVGMAQNSVQLAEYYLGLD